IALQLRGAKPDVTFLFASRDHADGFEEIAEGIQIETKSLHILGCTGESIAAGGQELEEGPALSLWSAVLPGAKLEVFHVEFEATPDGPICSGLPEAAPDAEGTRAVFLLADPYTSAI